MTGMIEVNTSDLIGPALDWAVAKAEGFPLSEEACQEGFILVGRGDGDLRVYEPSTNWSHGGPLIEKHVTALNQSGTESWWAHAEDRLGQGSTPLIAACRAIVASTLGDTVSVPKELAP